MCYPSLPYHFRKVDPACGAKNKTMRGPPSSPLECPKKKKKVIVKLTKSDTDLMVQKVPNRTLLIGCKRKHHNAEFSSRLKVGKVGTPLTGTLSFSI